MEEKKKSIRYIDERCTDIVNASHKIWSFAELSLKEHKSAELYEALLEKEGFRIEKNLCGLETAFSASFGEGKPLIGITAEYDALSGMSQSGATSVKEELMPGGPGHGCGHNMLGAAAFGAVLGIKNWLQSSGKSGTVVFYGCPGEEGGASKALLAREGIWKECDAVLTWHPGDTNEVVTGSCNSCIQVIYSFKGISSHAAGNPEQGRSALDAAELMNIGVQFLREHMKSDARIHYSFLNTGGVSPNVVQSSAKLLYMIRSPKVKDALELERRVDKIAEGAALMTETTLEKAFVDGCSGTVPNHTLEKLLFVNMKELSLPEYTSDELRFAKEIADTYASSDGLPGMGAKYNPEIASEVKKLYDNCSGPLNAFLLPLYSGDCFTPGSTDVGDVSWLTPTAQFNAVTWPDGCPGHSWQNVSCGASSIGDKGTIYAAKVLCASAVDLFTKPEILSAAAKELAERTSGGYYCPVPEGAKLLVIE